jgi:hypothetical protein
LSLKLYLDDCAYSRRLCQLLREAGHDVQTPADVLPPLIGADDAAHFAHAQTVGRAILTLNPRDFKALHDQDAAHAGALAIYQDNDPTRDMRYADIVRAIANLERSVPQIAGGFWILNAYRWS